MARSVWKGPFVEESLIKKVEKQKTDPKRMPIKTWSRKSTIIPEFIGVSFLIYNGKKFIPVTISEDMVGHKLGELSPTGQGAKGLKTRTNARTDKFIVRRRNKRKDSKK